MTDRRLPLRALLLTLLVLPCGLGWGQERSLTVLDPAVEAEPGSIVNLRLRLINEDPVSPWPVEPNLALPRGWRAVVPPGSLRLEPGRDLTLVVPLLVPEGATAGTYTFPVSYRLATGERAVEELVTVRVTEVEHIEVSVLDAPRLAADGPYAVTFLVSNLGNTASDLVLAARSSLAGEAEPQPNRLTLEPGAALEVLVSVEPGSSLVRRETNIVTLTARQAGTTQPAGVGRARTDLVPTSIPSEAAYHTFPLTVRFAGSLGGGAGQDSLAATSPTIELRGRGPLQPASPDVLDLRLKASLREGIEEAWIEYRTPRFGVALGRQSFATTPLTANDEAYGARVDTSWDATPGLRLTTTMSAYATDVGPAAGLRVRAEGGGNAWGASLRASPQDVLTSMSVEHTPDVADASRPHLSRADATVGLRHREGELGAGARFTIRFREGSSTASFSARTESAAFSGRDHHEAAFTAGARLVLDEALQVHEATPLHLHLEYANLARWDGVLPFTWVPPAPAPRSKEAIGVGLSTDVAGADLRFGYERKRERDEDSAETEHRVALRAEFAVGARLTLEPEVAWRRSLTEDTTSKDTLEFDAHGTLDLGDHGDLRPSLAVKAGLPTGEVEALVLGATWAGEAGNGLSLRTEGKFNVIGGEHLVDLTFAGRHHPTADHALDFQVAARAYRERPPEVALGLSYTMPFGIRIGRLPGIGEVSGRITDGRGRPLAGLVVTVADQATVAAPDGTFFFPAVPVGTHFLDVLPSDLLSPAQLITPTLPRTVRVEEAGRVTVGLRVVEGAALTGRVSVRAPSSAGAPRDAEETSSVTAGLRIELRRRNQVLQTLTDTAGRFSFQHLPPGEWTLRLADPLAREYEVALPEQPLGLASGQTEEVTIELTPVVWRTRIIEGGVLAPENDH